MLGNMPLPQVNADQVMSQGLPDLVSQYNQGISPTAPNPWPDVTQTPTMSNLTLPELPAPAPAPDISAVLAQVLGMVPKF